MKGKARSVSLFLAGTLIGVVIGSSATYNANIQPYRRIAANQYISAVMYDTENAQILRTGNARGVNQRIEMTLPRYVLTIDWQYRSHPMAIKALQNIRMYYEKNNIPIPADIQPVLSKVQR